MDRPVEVALTRSIPLRVAALMLVLLAAACSARRLAPSSEPAGATMGVYRASLESPSGARRKFRLLLYATLPDRLHGEILSPVGTTEVIVDGGSGRLAVTLPRDRISYVGKADAEAMAKVLGVPLSLEQLVGELLGETGERVEYDLERHPRGGKGLPQTLRISGAGYRLGLELKKKQPLRISTATLGNGEPPQGTELLPLERLQSLTDSEEEEW